MIRETLNMISEFGLAVVLLILLIFWIRSIIIWFKPKINDIWERALSKEEHTKQFRDNFRRRINSSLQINNCLNRILNFTNADRAFIFEFHNGGHNIAGVDFAKASNTYEALRMGVKPQMPNLQSLPLGMFAPFIKGAVNGVINKKIDDFKKEGDLSSFYALSEQGIKSIYVVGLYDEYDNPIGFVGLDYCTEDRYITKEGKIKMKQLAGKLSVMLTHNSKT